MAILKDSYLGYNTYILGTARNVLECLRIIVYDREALLKAGKVDKVSVYNLDQVIQQLKTKDPGETMWTELERSTADDPFQYSARVGFNTILYLSNSDGSGVGYSEFITTQGAHRSINIYTKFQAEISSGIEVKIVNSLVQLQNNSTVSKKFSGDEPYEYATVGDVWEWGKEMTERRKVLFSTHVSSLLSGDESVLWPGYGIVRGKDEWWRFKLHRNLNVDPFGNNFTFGSIGFYPPDDLVFYSWEGLKYSIYSLCKTNRFGNPYNYTVSASLGYVEIPAPEEGDWNIQEFSGRIAVVKGRTETKYFDTVERKYLSFPTPIFLDANDSTSFPQELPKIAYLGNVMEKVPEVLSTFFDIREFGKRNYLNIVKKCGDWFVFLEKRSAVSNPVYIFSSLRGTVKVDGSEYSGVILFNDNYLGVKSSSGLEIYAGLGEVWKTEAAAKSLGEWTLAEQERRETAKETGKIISISADTPLYEDPWLRRFKRSHTPVISNPPLVKNIIGGWGGILFYKTNESLNWF